MPDPFQPPNPGDPFIPSARRERLFLESALRPATPRDPKGLIGERDAGVVLVQNDTGGDLTADHPIVGLGAPLITPSDRENVVFERPVFSGVNPSPFVDGHFAVLEGPLASGGIGRAVISGGTWVRLYVHAEDHDSCRAIDSVTQLYTAEKGSGWILWKEAGLGEKWAFVRLGNPPGSRLILVKLKSDHLIGLTLSHPIYRGSPFMLGEEDAGRELPIANRFANLTSGAWAFVDGPREHGAYEYVTASCTPMPPDYPEQPSTSVCWNSTDPSGTCVEGLSAEDCLALHGENGNYRESQSGGCAGLLRSACYDGTDPSGTCVEGLTAEECNNLYGGVAFYFQDRVDGCDGVGGP